MSRSFRFMPQEVNEMEEQLKPLSDCKPDRDLMRELAVMFSHFRKRDGMIPVNAQQVLNWFHNRRYSKSRTKTASGEPLALRKVKQSRDAQQQEAGSSATAFDLNLLLDELPLEHQEGHEIVDLPLPKGNGFDLNLPLEEFGEVDFDFFQNNSGNKPLVTDPTSYEAKLTRDGSWHNVHQFLSRRLCESGDSEVKVRLSGFRAEEVEWINSRTCLRPRSLPCKATDCVTVTCRDIVLCYKNGLHFDAKVEGIGRKMHDSSACDCTFFVIYQHDKSEEFVPLRKLRLRPETLNSWIEKQKREE